MCEHISTPFHSTCAFVRGYLHYKYSTRSNYWNTSKNKSLWIQYRAHTTDSKRPEFYIILLTPGFPSTRVFFPNNPRWRWHHCLNKLSKPIQYLYGTEYVYTWTRVPPTHKLTWKWGHLGGLSPKVRTTGRMPRAGEIVLPRKVHADWLFNTNENIHLRTIIQMKQMVFMDLGKKYIYIFNNN